MGISHVSFNPQSDCDNTIMTKHIGDSVTILKVGMSRHIFRYRDISLELSYSSDIQVVPYASRKSAIVDNPLKNSEKSPSSKYYK